MDKELKSKKGTYTKGIAVLMAVAAHVAIVEVHTPHIAADGAVLRTRPVAVVVAVVTTENRSTSLLDLSI